MNDPTHDRKAIEANPTWQLAFVLSELMNDFAPIGWGKYILPAASLLVHFDITLKGAIKREAQKTDALILAHDELRIKELEDQIRINQEGAAEPIPK